MLVLSRKCDETIKIGEDILITVVEINGGKVKLGILAPKNVRVLRGELPAKKSGLYDEICNGDKP